MYVNWLGKTYTPTLCCLIQIWVSKRIYFSNSLKWESWTDCHVCSKYMNYLCRKNNTICTRWSYHNYNYHTICDFFYDSSDLKESRIVLPSHSRTTQRLGYMQTPCPRPAENKNKNCFLTYTMCILKQWSECLRVCTEHIIYLWFVQKVSKDVSSVFCVKACLRLICVCSR